MVVQGNFRPLKAVDLVPYRAAPQYIEARIAHTRKGFITWTSQQVWVHQRGGVVWQGYKSVYLPLYHCVAECTFGGRWQSCFYREKGNCWHVFL